MDIEVLWYKYYRRAGNTCSCSEEKETVKQDKKWCHMAGEVSNRNVVLQSFFSSVNLCNFNLQ